MTTTTSDATGSDAHRAPMATIDAAVVRELERALSREQVVASAAELIAYEYDGTIERGKPQAVVFPENTAQVAAAVRIAHAHGLPVIPRGRGRG